MGLEGKLDEILDSLIGRPDVVSLKLLHLGIQIKQLNPSILNLAPPSSS